MKYVIVVGFVAIYWTTFICGAAIDGPNLIDEDEKPIKDKLNQYNIEAIKYCTKAVEADWQFQINFTNDTLEKEKITAFNDYATFRLQNYNDWIKDAKKEGDAEVDRQIDLLQNIDTAILKEDDYKKLITVISNMTKNYASIAICPADKKDCKTADEKLDFYNEIEKIMATSRDPNELIYYWDEWHSNAAIVIRDDYNEYVRLLNEAASKITENATATKLWQSQYEDENIVEVADKLWKEIQPLYYELHKYVQRNLLIIYNETEISDFNKTSEQIPAHLLGTMHANSWSNLYDQTKPHDGKFNINFTAVQSNRAMFDATVSFYTSIGLNALPFGASILQKPETGRIMCDAEAFDFCDGQDFRVKMCPTANFHDYTMIHNKLGHMQYFTQFKDMALPLRHEAYPGLYEALGGMTSLAVNTPDTLTRMRLLTDYEDKAEDNINALYLMALEHIPALPYALLVDKWRWTVFDSNAGDLNTLWWNLQKEFMNISAPNERDATKFDVAGNHHVVADKQYLSEFLGHILKFQIFHKLCDGHFDASKHNLHKCDLSFLYEIGTNLSAILKTGKLNDYKKVLKELTGEESISTKGLLEYFNVLHDFLEKENADDSDDTTLAPTINPPVVTSPETTPTTPTSSTTPLPNSYIPMSHDNTLPIVVGLLICALIVGAGSGFVYLYVKNRG